MKIIKTIIYLVLGLSSMSFASETKYQKCYDIAISADIKACMNDQQRESMKKSYDEKKAFIERGYNNVFQQEDF